MATGFGLSNKGKANSAGEELQDIDWDSIPADKRGMTPGQSSPKGKSGGALSEPDPFNESQLVAQDSTEVFYGDEQDTGAELGAAQVKTNAKKTDDPNNGVKVKKMPLPGKK